MEFLVEFVAVLVGDRVQGSVWFGLALVVVSALTLVRAAGHGAIDSHALGSVHVL